VDSILPFEMINGCEPQTIYRHDQLVNFESFNAALFACSLFCDAISSI